MANNTGTFFNINDNDGIPLVGVSTDGKVMINHLYGNCLIGSTSVTRTASQPLQVTGGAYVSGNIGIGTTNPTSKLHVVGDGNFTGIVTASRLVSNVTSEEPITVGSSTLVTNLNVNYLNGQGSSYYTNAANITTGTISSSRLTGSYGISITGTATTATNLSNAANITTGTISSSRLTGSYGISITGTATTATNLSNAANITTGTISSSRLTGSYGISITGTATTATNLSNAANITTGTISSSRLSGTYNINVSYANTAGIATVAQGLTGTPNITVGVVTATRGNFSGIIISSGAVISGVTTSNGFNATTGNDYEINGTSVLTSTTLGSGVVNSSLTSVGTLTNLNVGNINSTGIITATRGNFSGIITSSGAVISGVSTISVNSSFNALRITQTGTGNALVVEDSTNPDATPFVVGADGSVGIGTTNPTSKLQVVGGDVRVGVDTSQGVILTSENGTKFRILVSDSGVLSTVLVS